MTFLELCQSLAQEADINGGATLPTTVAGQTGELRRVVDWVKQSWRSIQGKRHWDWMWQRPTLTMLAGTSSLAGTIPEERYLKDRLYVPTAGQLGRFPEFMPWDMFTKMYPFIQPGPTFSVWSIAPDHSIRVDVQVTADVDFNVERYALPTELTADSDVPGLPSDLHMLIVWRALVKYANFDGAGDQRTTAIEEFNEMEAQLVERCLPGWRLGAPLGGE
jgi:hypothetical protein